MKRLANVCQTSGSHLLLKTITGIQPGADSLDKLKAVLTLIFLGVAKLMCVLR